LIILLISTRWFTEVYMDGKMIAQKRKERGMTQDELGKILGISGKAVSKWERGLSNPRDSHKKKLIDLLGLPVEQEPRLTGKPLSSLILAIFGEWARMFATGIMLAVSICCYLGTLSINSTVVSLGFSATLFCLATMLRK
jgi:transcriptional regulator with XRE-family HTH domain